VKGKRIWKDDFSVKISFKFFLVMITCCCFGIQSIAAIVITATVTASVTNCSADGKLVISATGTAGTVNYALIAPSPVTRAKQTSNTFTLLPPGTYTVAVYDNNNPTTPVTKVFTVGVTDVLVVTSPATICAGSSVDLTAAAITAGSKGVASLNYYSDAAATIPLNNPASVGPLTTTTYYISAMASDGCLINTSPVTVTVKPVASAQMITAPGAVVCNNSTVTLTATSNLASPTFKWYTSNNLTGLVNTGASFKTPAITANTTYYVTVQNATTCENLPGTALRVDVTLGSACGTISATGCSATGTLVTLTDFGGNNASDPVYSTTSLPTGTTTYSFANGQANYPPQTDQYALSKTSVAKPPANTFAHWYKTITDHTGNGYMAVFNADVATGTFYTQTLNNLCSGTTLFFSAWVVSVDSVKADINPSLTFILTNPLTGDVLSTLYTGNIPNGDKNWRQYGLSFTVPTGVSSVNLSIKNIAAGGTGNDLALDDIAIHSCAPPVTITGLKTGGNYCDNENLNLTASYTDDGTLGTGLVYQWYYSPTGDTTTWDSWTAISGGNVMNLVKTPPVTGYYRAVVANPDNINAGRFYCSAVSKEVQVIVNPSPIIDAPKGESVICLGKSTVLTTTTVGGFWNTQNSTVATVNPAGTVFATGVGTTSIDYAVTNTSGCTTIASTSVTVKDCALPVTISYFTATVQTSCSCVLLQWATTFESNSKYFEIQRSNDGQQWAIIDTIIVKGIATGAQYTYTDSTPHLGKNYYRFKTIDLDGKFDFSPIKSVDLESGLMINKMVVWYPNGTTGKIYVSCSKPIDRLTLTDMSGKVVYSIANIPNRKVSVFLPQSLTNGLYTITFNIKGTLQTDKLFFIK